MSAPTTTTVPKTTTPTPSFSSSTTSLQVSNISTLVILLYIAAPCIITLILTPILIYYIIRQIRKRRKERELQELHEKKRRDAFSVLGVGGRMMGAGTITGGW
ncbi:MAG: hypothetical protein Q9181_004173 [Wetmoreana brouardii]